MAEGAAEPAAPEPAAPESGAAGEGGAPAAASWSAEEAEGAGAGVGARDAARPMARGTPKPGGGPRAGRDRPPDGVAEGPAVAGGDEATRGTCC